jgi:hypothetical protein
MIDTEIKDAGCTEFCLLASTSNGVMYLKVIHFGFLILQMTKT